MFRPHNKALNSRLEGSAECSGAPAHVELPTWLPAKSGTWTRHLHLQLAHPVRQADFSFENTWSSDPALTYQAQGTIHYNIHPRVAAKWTHIHLTHESSHCWPDSHLKFFKIKKATILDPGRFFKVSNYFISLAWQQLTSKSQNLMPTKRTYR